MVSHVGARIDVAVVTALSRFSSRSGLARQPSFSGTSNFLYAVRKRVTDLE